MLGSLIRRPTRATPNQMGWLDYQRLWEQFGFNGVSYMVPNSALSSLTALQAMRNPIVQACIMIRCMCVSEIRFAFVRQNPTRLGRGDLFVADQLGVLDTPWANAQDGELAFRLQLDADLYGNSYWRWDPENRCLVRIDPTKVKILTGSALDENEAKVGEILLGYQVQNAAGQPEATFLPGEIVHYKPLADPDHAFRGLSWLSALLPDITADQDMTVYKHSFLNNAATPNLAVTFSQNIGQDAFNAFKERMETAHTGPSQGFKTLYLGAGADIKTVGSNFADLSLENIQAYGETRICVAAGVPASLVGIAEGMKGSTLNTANYGASRRRFSDITIRPLWRKMCKTLENICPPPAGSRLWYDDRDIVFLMADMQDQASVRASDSSTIVNLTNSGYTPDSIISAIAENDFSLLQHSGLVSIQLQPITPPTGDGGSGGDVSDETSNADDTQT